jgi:hypothetical protein
MTAGHEDKHENEPTTAAGTQGRTEWRSSNAVRVQMPAVVLSPLPRQSATRYDPTGLHLHAIQEMDTAAAISSPLQKA